MKYEYRDSEESKQNGITYHLAIEEEWIGQKNSEGYKPGAFDSEGFIHCTNGLDLLTEVANRYYKNSLEPRTVLVLDINKLQPEVRYDDAEKRFPHIYGPLNPSAVMAELPVKRQEDGTFVQLGSH